MTYAVVAGTTTFTVVPWLATRPAVLRWTIRRLDAITREETGLSLAVGQVEFHPALGYVVLHDVQLGGDLLTVQRVEIQADIWSLLGPAHRIHLVRVEHPHVRLTEANLAALKLKSHPPRQGPLPQFELELFSLTGGEILAPQPVRGIPEFRYQFDMKATGLGPNHLRIDLAGPQLAIKAPGGWMKGRLDLNGEASEPVLTLQEAYLRLGESQMRLHGRYELPSKAQDRLEASFTGILDLAQTARWSGMTRPPMSGDLSLGGTVKGSTTHPVWTFSAEGQDLTPTQAALSPGNLALKADGALDRMRLEFLRWNSTQGDVEIKGSWSQRAPIQAELRGVNLDLETLGHSLRLPGLRGVRGTVQAQLHAPGKGDLATRLDRWQASFSAGLSQNGREAGGLEGSLNQGQMVLDRLNVDLDSLKLDGTGSAILGPKGMVRLAGDGHVAVGADQVAQALRDWKVVDLDMSGQATAQAKVRWDRTSGLELDGSVEVNQPRWHGAQADSLQAKAVEIRGADLRVQDIEIRKGEGFGGGQLWLTWARALPGQSQMDMCYFASRLPVTEGLRAADLKDDLGKDLPITGTGSGWVRLQGPYDHLTMAGSAQVETGEVYGIKIPAASSDFWMDLTTLQMKLSDVRIAERPDLLGRTGLPPEGALALTGQADMDFKNATWWVDLSGRVDSQLLAIPGPRMQAQIEARLLGPITSPFGSLDLPDGTATFSRGRVFLGDRSVEGLEGKLRLERGRLAGSLGMEGMTIPVIDFQVRQEGPDLVGGLKLDITSDSAHTEALARGLTDDLLENLNLTATAQGRWKLGRELSWNGSLDRLSAQFNAFELHQAGPSALRGNDLGAVVDVVLEGGGRVPALQADGLTSATTPDIARAAHLQLSGTVPFARSAPMDIRIQGGADLAHMKSILDRFMEVDEYSLLSELHVQGTSRLDIRAHGIYSEPLLDGTLSIDNGLVNLRRYQGIENLHAQVILKDRTLTVSAENPIRGTMVDGDLMASGTATWRLGGLDAYAMKASLANFHLRDVPDGLDLQGSLQATLEGTEDGGLLKGKLRADRLSFQTEVKLADLILRSALNDSGGFAGLDLDDPLDKIKLDLDMDLRTPWTFDTNLLKLEGHTDGPFQVLGTLGHPVPKGKLLFQAGGRITNIFPAGDVVVDRGSLTFSESQALDPIISIQGTVSSIPGYTVNLDAHGTLGNLSIMSSSTPSLRQDEIISILINPGNVANVGTAGTNTGSTQGAINQGVASAGVGLLSTLAFAPVQDQLRRTLGVDRVNVAVRTSSIGASETEFTVGKSFDLFGQRSAFVIQQQKNADQPRKTSGQVEWRFGNVILQFGVSQTSGEKVAPSGEVRHTWSPK